MVKDAGPKPTGDLLTLSDRFMAYVALQATDPAAAAVLSIRLRVKLRFEGHLLRPEKRADMEKVVAWLELCAEGRT